MKPLNVNEEICVASICKNDLLLLFKGDNDRIEIIKNMSNEDMEYVVSKLSDDDRMRLRKVFNV